MSKKHEVVFAIGKSKISALWTQEQLAKNLNNPDLKLISVNAKKHKRKKVSS